MAIIKNSKGQYSLCVITLNIHVNKILSTGIFPDGLKFLEVKPLHRCPKRNVPNFGRVFLMLKYTDITKNIYIQSLTVTEIMAR